MSVIVPIHKPGKDAASCKKFRPISLTSTLSKIMKQIIHSRIMNWLIKQKVLYFNQTAYRAQHSTVDQLFYLIQSIIDEFQEKPHRGKLWPFYLIFLRPLTEFGDKKKSLKFCIPEASRNIVLWINDFLSDRRFAVRVNGSSLGHIGLR
ncbi:hypothetical protein TNIN_440461 [Trichonephila inaurata madagascariensis]|uniref:Reverse transcriptase n=1 Tax=Trichonephila inaurata madagascariensis TaxID=2747483 RepID=A0A8X6YL37_9ARAC|nr:hypothetical protein TNIN_440461 [Trichonephila inaurata madagascariensis]